VKVVAFGFAMPVDILSKALGRWGKRRMSSLPTNFHKKMRFNQATRNDVSFIVELLANDKLGQSREQYEEPLPE
jgi:hypothetical protein